MSVSHSFLRRHNKHFSRDSPNVHLLKVGSSRGLAAGEEELKEVHRIAKVVGSWKTVPVNHPFGNGGGESSAS